MAQFCTRCGSPVDPPSAFCPKCGTRLQDAATPPAASAPVSIQAPAKSGGSLVKVLLIVLGVFAGVTVLGVGSCLYLGYRLKQKVQEVVKIDKLGEPGQSVTIRTPEGELKLSDRSGKTAAIGGVPPYPGSTPVEAGAELSFGALGSIAGQEYVTEDPVEKVVAFYKEKLEGKLMVVENQGHFRLALAGERGEGATTIDVHRDEAADKTRIFVARVGK